jgi:hypothetical protein
MDSPLEDALMQVNITNTYTSSLSSVCFSFDTLVIDLGSHFQQLRS